IGWSYLNGSGLVIPGTSNVLGTAGLYGAGIFYWMLGAMATFLSQNLIIKLRNNGNILFSQRAPSANPTTSKKQSQNIGIFP
ncbi:hypothetical protein, partial [Barnesiella intestinihominis]|uniref:hypothetical protein n=1 Tax=Barnesiella intestinihominis TaxID=487174 RepID=UPI003AB12741